MRFNIRVYGLLVYDENVLISNEQIGGRLITKFPGGGLEFGEGTIDCVKREFLEELNLKIEVDSHFYTTEFFVKSAFDDSQVMSIYYKITTENPAGINLESIIEPNQRFQWHSISKLSKGLFTFPIDKIVFELLNKQ